MQQDVHSIDPTSPAEGKFPVGPPFRRKSVEAVVGGRLVASRRSRAGHRRPSRKLFRLVEGGRSGKRLSVEGVMEGVMEGVRSVEGVRSGYRFSRLIEAVKTRKYGLPTEGFVRGSRSLPRVRQTSEEGMVSGFSEYWRIIQGGVHRRFQFFWRSRTDLARPTAIGRLCSAGCSEGR